MKIAVFFPGIGYHCDKPLLYYSGKIADKYQYEAVKIVYTGLSRSVEEAFRDALEQTRKQLEGIDWAACEDILFVSKSIGTAVACAYAAQYHIQCRNIYYTPLVQTFGFSPQPGLMFHGTDDPWADTPAVQEKCREARQPLQLIENANHSLEIKDDIQRNLHILKDVMGLTEEYIAGTLQYRELYEEEICQELFGGFIRRQDVTDCWRQENGEWIVRPDPFTDDWTQEDYRFLVSCLKNTLRTGGYVYGAFYCGALKGFVSVEPGLFGGGLRYLDLSCLHVSRELRGRGTGRILFQAAAAWAREHGAARLYISGHSAVETQAFYQAMGCAKAQEYNQAHVEKEPFDCQLEYVL